MRVAGPDLKDCRFWRSHYILHTAFPTAPLAFKRCALPPAPLFPPSEHKAAAEKATAALQNQEVAHKQQQEALTATNSDLQARLQEKTMRLEQINKDLEALKSLHETTQGTATDSRVVLETEVMDLRAYIKEKNQHQADLEVYHGVL